MEIKYKDRILQLESFDPLTASKEVWRRYHKLRRLQLEEENPGDPISSDESAEQSIKANTQFPEAEIKLFNLIDPEKDIQVGYLEQVVITEESPSYEGTKHLLQFSLYLLSEYRRNKVGSRLLKLLYDRALELDKKVLMTGSSTSSGKAFLTKVGAILALQGAENRLNLDDVDWAMVDEWISSGEKRNETTKINVYNEIPEEILKDYCNLYTEVMNQQPLGELDVGAVIMGPETYRQQEAMLKNMGRKTITMVTQEADGALSGLTEVRYNPNRETFISQGLTGVQLDYRGKGLGKLLKAKMLNYIQNELTKVRIVTTGNATSNAPMLSINERLGFKKYKETIGAQITLDKLKEYLEAKLTG